MMAMISIDRLLSLEQIPSRRVSFAIAITMYRNARYQESLEAIQSNFSPASDQYQGLAYCVASMAHYQMGNIAKAKEYKALADAVNLNEFNALQTHEFRMWLREANKISNIVMLSTIK